MSDQRQVPLGPKHLDCPLHQKPMVKVCHKCPWWRHVLGKDPQYDDKMVDQWDCAVGWLPKLLIENTQMSRQTGAAVESFRNESIRTVNLPAMQQLFRLIVSPKKVEIPKLGVGDE